MNDQEKNFRDILIEIAKYALIICGVTGILAVLKDTRDWYTLEIFLTTLTIGGASLTALACATRFNTPGKHLIAKFGIATSVVASIVAIIGVWDVNQFIYLSGRPYWKVLSSSCILASFSAVLCLLRLVPLQRSVAWLQHLATLLVPTLTLVLVGVIIKESSDNDLIFKAITTLSVGTALTVLTIPMRFFRANVAGLIQVLCLELIQFAFVVASAVGITILWKEAYHWLTDDIMATTATVFAAVFTSLACAYQVERKKNKAYINLGYAGIITSVLMAICFILEIWDWVHTADFFRITLSITVSAIACTHICLLGLATLRGKYQLLEKIGWWSILGTATFIIFLIMAEPSGSYFTTIVILSIVNVTVTGLTPVFHYKSKKLALTA